MLHVTCVMKMVINIFYYFAPKYMKITSLFSNLRIHIFFEQDNKLDIKTLDNLEECFLFGVPEGDEKL